MNLHRNPFLILVFGLALRVAQADTVYTLAPFTGGGYELTGTITTDGATGLLASSDIAAWAITITTPNTPTVTLQNGVNSTDVLLGNDLTATPTELIFDFGDLAVGTLAFVASGPDAQELAYDTSGYISAGYGPYHGNASCECITDATGEFAALIGGPPAGVIAGPASVFATPEPSTLVLVAMGLLALAAFRGWARIAA